MILHGRVDPSGDLFLDTPEVLIPLSGKRVVVEVMPEEERRSNQANRYWHGVIVRHVREILNAGREIPLSAFQVHYILTGAFGTQKQPDTEYGPVPVESHRMTKREFGDMVESVLAHFRALGFDIPGPNEPYLEER